jgi:hypothetical protein
MAEPGVERADRELLAVPLFFSDCFNGGALDDEYAWVAPRQVVRGFSGSCGDAVGRGRDYLE